MQSQNCYIRVVNGKAFEHPITEENLKQVVKNFDSENLPEGIEKFVRQEPRAINFLETLVGSSYQFVDGVWQDVYDIRPLTEDEKKAKIKFMRDTFPFSNWELDETTGQWIPPIPYPNDGLVYGWDEDKSEWVLVESNFKPSL